MPARGTIRCLTALASIITLVPFSFAAIDCNAESHTISSQQDASDLDECAESGQKIRGEVVISPETATDIEIASFGNINGRIVATDNPYLESLKLGNATTATSETSPSLSLINVTSLGSLVFDDSVWRLGDLDLRSLPKLATLDWGVGRPPIDPYIAQNLELLEVGSVTLTGLPNLRKIGSSGQEIVLGLNVTMKDVALESVDAFTNFTESRHLAIEGIPNVNRITFSYVLSESVTIQGNGELDIAFTHPDYRGWYAETQTIQDLTISGVKSLERTFNVEWPYRYLKVGNLTFENNTIGKIPLDIFDRVTNLYVRNNAHLGYLAFPLNFDLFPWENIEITGNPRLDMSNPNFPGNQWRWPLLGARSIVFEVGRGDLFSIYLAVSSRNLTQRPLTREKFVLRTVVDPDCGELDRLRREGAFKGEYFCGTVDQYNSPASREIPPVPHMGRDAWILLLIATACLHGMGLP